VAVGELGAQGVSTGAVTSSYDAEPIVCWQGGPTGKLNGPLHGYCTLALHVGAAVHVQDEQPRVSAAPP
jgi:hypothetical protein